MRDVSNVSDFWSRRRAAVQMEEEQARAAEDMADRQARQAALEDKSDTAILAELDLPEPESLQEGDDFSAFMAQAVPDRIRRRALRVLWRANPVLANLDELLEYGEDYTDAATVVENLQTAYQVGRGMLEHVEKMARQAEDAEAGEAVAETARPEPTDDMPPVASQPAQPDEPVRTLSEIKDETRPVCEDEPIAVLAPRRMKFRSEEPA